MSRYQVRADLVLQDLGGELVVVDSRCDAVHVLNATGAAILHALKEPLAPADLVAGLAEAFAADAEQIAGDVNAYLERLEQAGLIQWQT